MATTARVFEAERGATTGITDVRWLDLTTAICPLDRCAILRAGRPVYSDGNHVAASRAELQAPRFEEALEGWPLGSAVRVPSVRQPERSSE